jgi:hypothetical protein
MALTTYSGLKASIADWLNRSDLTNQIDDFIGLAEADFNAKLRIRQMEQIDAITIDSETETVPTGFIGVRSFYILSAGTKYALEYITPHNMFEIKAGSTTARPRVYTIESDNAAESLRFGPAPDSAYTGYLSNQVQQWLQMYIAAMERCENNDKQDSYGGAPVQQRTDVQTDLSFYRAR